VKTTVIYHSADFDGIFCREIARKFLPDAELIGWNFGDKPLEIPNGSIYVLDLPVDRVFGFDFGSDVSVAARFQSVEAMKEFDARLVWIDHHASSIASHPTTIPGYRIDGVAACRLTFQWFLKQWRMSTGMVWLLPDKTQFIDRKVTEPEAVRLAGEYDIWDKRDPRADVFQFGLRSEPLDEYWPTLLDQDSDGRYRGFHIVTRLLGNGELLHRYQNEQNASVIKDLGFTFQWEGLTWLACNHARYNSHLFTAALRPEHDACFGFKFTGHCAAGVPAPDWSISLYHAPGKEHHDLSQIAVKWGKEIDPLTGKPFGGGGHRGACGFRTNKLPFLK
jgi:hypothetical protein